MDSRFLKDAWHILVQGSILIFVLALIFLVMNLLIKAGEDETKRIQKENLQKQIEQNYQEEIEESLNIFFRRAYE